MAPENAPPHVPADCCAAQLVTGKARIPAPYSTKAMRKLPIPPLPPNGRYPMICRAIARNATGLTTLRHATCWARKLFRRLIDKVRFIYGILT